MDTAQKNAALATVPTCSLSVSWSLEAKQRSVGRNSRNHFASQGSQNSLGTGQQQISTAGRLAARVRIEAAAREAHPPRVRLLQ